MARLLAVAALLLLAAPAAQAKAPPLGVTICGAAGTCRSLTQQEAERMPIWGLTSAVAPAKPAPFYAIRYRWRAEEPERTSYWVPSSGLFRADGLVLKAWFRFGRGALEPFVEGLAPIEVPRITSVTVGGRRAQSPSTYIRLFTAGRAVKIFPAQSWIRLRFTAAAPSPWADETTDVRITRGASYLLRDDTVFVIPKRLADRARRGLPLL